MITVQDIKKHKKLKIMFSRMLSVSQRTIQLMSDELITIAGSNSDTLSAANVLAFAVTDTTSLYKAFDWGATGEERTAVAEALLAQVTVLISTDNNIYRVSVQ